VYHVPARYTHPVTVLATNEGTVTVTGNPTAFARFDVEKTVSNPFAIDLTPDRSAQVAAAQRYSRLGVKVELQRPDGVWMTLPDREVGNVCTIEEDADTFGDRLTIQLVGPRFSPFSRALLRAMTGVRITYVIGSPLHEHRQQVFSGFVASATFSTNPPAATVICLDEAGRHAMKKLPDFSVAPSSGRTRMSIVTEMLTQADIPHALDFGGGDGGTVTKPVVPGDRPVLEFIREYLWVIGLEIGFENNILVSRPFGLDRPPTLELTPANLIPPADLTSPETLSPNVLGVVSVSYTPVAGEGGEVTTPEEVLTVAPYAAKVYTQLQTGDGTLIANPGPFQSASPQLISRILTNTTKRGNVETRYEQTEEEFYAKRGTRNTIVEDEESSLGYVIEPDAGFIFEDGSTRAVPSESFQLVRRTLRTADLTMINGLSAVDPAFNVWVTRRIERRYQHRFFRLSLWNVSWSPTEVTETLLRDNAKISDDGQAVEDGYETLGKYGAEEETETEYEINADGTLASETVTERFHSIGAPRFRSDGARGYGVDNREYTDRDAEVIGPTNAHAGWRKTVKRYSLIKGDEDRYRTTETLTDSDGKGPEVKTTTAVGSLPRVERVDAATSSQEIRAEAVDAERVALAGQEINSTVHNEWIENEAEARTLAIILAKQAGAIRIECDMPIETLLHKGRTVQVSVPNAAISDRIFHVRAVSRNAADFTQRVRAEIYPAQIT